MEIKTVRLRTLKAVSGLLGALILSSIVCADPGIVSCSVSDVPVRLAIKVLWSSGAPANTTYEVRREVPEDTRVNLSLENVPFEAALDAVCQAAGLKYTVSGGKYVFSRSDRRSSSISIVRAGDKVTWKLRDADPLDVLVQLLDAFSKKFELKLDADPRDQLEDQAKRYSQELEQIALAGGTEQSNRMKELLKDAERYIKPPKSIPRGTAKSLSAEDTQIPFGDAMDVLSRAAGFLWFRAGDGKIIIRDTTTADAVRQIFNREKVWEALQKR